MAIMPRSCTNCGEPWSGHTGTYCHHCGQEKPVTPPEGTRVRWAGNDGSQGWNRPEATGTMDAEGGVAWDDGTFCPNSRLELEFLEVIS